MKRFVAILRTQLSQLKPVDLLNLAKDWLFRNEPIVIYGIDTSNSFPKHPAAQSDICVCRGSIDALNRYLTTIDPVPWEFQCHLIDGVAEHYIALAKGETIQHISWVYYEKDPNRIIRLAGDQAEIKYCLTLPKYRGIGIYPVVLRTIVSQLAENGIRRVFIAARADNFASMRGIEKAGFTKLSRIRLIKMMGLQLSRRYKPSEPQPLPR